ncbi:MAG: VWA domain-containing protein [Actinomycetota bacterium]
MLERVLEFSHALRSAGIPVAVSEDMDALKALGEVDLVERDSMRAALAATMIKSAAHRPAFDTLFDLYFGAGRGPDALDERDAEDEPLEPEDYLNELFNALMSGDASAIRDMARRAVSQFGRVEGTRTGSPYFQYRVYRVVDLDAMLSRLMEEMAGREMGPLEERMWRDEFEERVRKFRQEVESEVRRRLAEHRGAEQVARHAVRPLPEDLDFVRATGDEVATMRRAIRPLARKLATRLAMKRRPGRKGRLDVRRTLRHSLSTGGVPFDTHFRRRHEHKPDLFLVCDISGSVSAFARFTLMFVHAFQAQFSRVRSFVFVDTLDEVTRFFEHEDFVDAVDRMNREADVVWLDGHSDYGSSLERFWKRYGTEVGPRSSVVVLGDARNNYRASGAWVLKELRKRARKVYWLNPEPKQYWDTGDSIASEYAHNCDDMVEVRNLKSLQAFVAKM